MNEIIEGILFALVPLAILANLLGVILGIVFGALPGLTATMGLALIVPLTFGIPPVVAFSALLGVFLGDVYVGLISETLFGTHVTAFVSVTIIVGLDMIHYVM